MHLQRSNEYDRGREADTIEGLETTLQQSQSEVQSLRNQLARLEFTKPKKDKGKGKARATTYTPDSDPLRHNPLPAPPMAISMERYATLAGDSSTEVQQVVAAIEASVQDRIGRDGYSSDVGTSSAGAGPSRSRDTNGQVTSAQNPETIGYPHIEPPAGYFPAQSQPPPISSLTSLPRRSSQSEALPNVLDAAVWQAQQLASRSSPSRRHRIVPGATENDRIYIPPNTGQQWPQAGSQTTYVNGYASVPPLPVSAPAEESFRKHRRQHKSKSRTHPREEYTTREGGEREDIAGVVGLGLIDESSEERRRADPQAAFASGYVEGLNTGFHARVGTSPAPPLSAPLPRSVRFNHPAESIVPPANTTTITSNTAQQAQRRSTAQNTVQSMTPEGLASRLRDLMEDPIRSVPASRAQFADHRASAVSSETLTWGTVTTSNSSRRQSNASDVMAQLRGFPQHGLAQSRASLASSQEIPVGDPRAFLPIVPPNANLERPPTDRTNEIASHSTLTGPSARPDTLSNPRYNSQTPTASNIRAATRSNAVGVSQVNQSDSGSANTTRPPNQRYTSLPINTVNTTSTTPSGNMQSLSGRHSRDHRPQPLRQNPMSNYHPNYNSNSSSNPNPLPIVPSLGYPAPSIASAPPRPVFHEYSSAPAIPMMSMTPAAPHGSSANRASRASRASHHHNPSSSSIPINLNLDTRTPVADANALGLDMIPTNYDDDYDYSRGYEPEPIPAFAAPTPRASHNMFLRSFSFDGIVDGDEVDGSLYR
ncbi:hypothetical protein GGU10DRAFT_20533 [Lentinula aff. detonsa]|uniref:Uncharacterized protein n=1 Tax=Lentinula aff. detonsa TaxID=2804958 RepID=A0AA38NIZ8_9AGAR|nr:hypothetical protein GGU10DRAFT_20533 [Lentinula aff. detonsa]